MCRGVRQRGVHAAVRAARGHPRAPRAQADQRDARTGALLLESYRLLLALHHVTLSERLCGKLGSLHSRHSIGTSACAMCAAMALALSARCSARGREVSTHKQARARSQQRRRFPSKRQLRVQDMWSLGVIVYEALTDKAAISPFSKMDEIYRLAQGSMYPWEAPDAPAVYAKSRVRKVIDSCLSRDPEQRPSAERVLSMLDRLGQSTTLA